MSENINKRNYTSYSYYTCDACGGYAIRRIQMDDDSPLYLCDKCYNKWSKMGQTIKKENE